MKDVAGNELESLTISEELVLEVIYGHDESLSLNEVKDACNLKYGKNWAPQTVSTFLARIVRKGYLESHREGRLFFYTPLVPRKDYLKQKTQDYIKFWYHDNVGEMLESLTQERKLTEREITNIKKIIVSNR